MSNITSKFKTLFPIIEKLEDLWFENHYLEDLFVISNRNQILNANSLVKIENIDAIFQKLNKTIPDQLEFVKPYITHLLLNLNSIEIDQLYYYIFTHRTSEQNFDFLKNHYPFNYDNFIPGKYYHQIGIEFKLMNQQISEYKHIWYDRENQKTFNFIFDHNNQFVDLKEEISSSVLDLNYLNNKLTQIDIDQLKSENIKIKQSARVEDSQYYTTFVNLHDTNYYTILANTSEPLPKIFGVFPTSPPEDAIVPPNIPIDE